MNTLLAELSNRLAEKWLTLLTLPGVLFLGTSAVALSVGHNHWADVEQLLAAGRAASDDLGAEGPVAVGLALVAVLLAASAAGLAARGIGVVVQQVWLGLWPPAGRPVVRSIVRRRRARWQQLQEKYAAVVVSPHAQPGAADAIAEARNRIAVSRPQRATWMGDRIAAVEARVHGQYRLDLVSAWPRLWLLLPDSARTELKAANERLQGSAIMAAWGLLYLVLGPWWWPALGIGAGVIVIGWRTARTATDSLAELIEAAVDLHANDVAVAVGLLAEGARFTEQVGQDLTQTIRKGA
jgi:hypothetical protein